jgi:hypothetical protein
MEKPSSRSNAVVSLMIPLMAAAFVAQSCAGAETPKTGGATGGGNATTGGRSGSTGGSSSLGTGGASSTSTGGSSSASGGSSGFGTGGSSGFGTGGGPIVGTGTGGGSVTPGALAVTDGYAVSSAGWMGYGYTFVGPMTGSTATVTPMNFAAMTSLCESGMIAPDPMYASVAGLGWNINQAKGLTATPPEIMTVPSSGTGLSIKVSATGLTLAAGAGSQLRAQIKTAGGDFCAPISAAGGVSIPWASFNKTCWDTTAVGAMAFVPGTPIRAVELTVPSSTTAVGPFMLCLLDAHTY